MSYYTNPQIPEDMDDSRSGHFSAFLITCLKVVILFFLFIAAMDVAARFLAPYVPFHWENALVPQALVAGPTSQADIKIENELNNLAQRLTATMDMPPDIIITVHYSDQDIINAGATFGGHIFVFRGLLEEMESEDALATVLAHEIGHIKHRDALRGLWRTFSLAVILAVSNSSSSFDLGTIAGEPIMMSYSRGQEYKADEEATKAIGKLYGHTQGFERSFNALAAATIGSVEGLEMLSSHPDTQKRIARSQQNAVDWGYPTQGPATPLPSNLAAKKQKPENH